ncbi:FadR/GntR family transcriptional regulator [Nakamurella sp. PAMC28650]|uniref:FadR/GntR family transcriptional regulator n=1 Tax=Nakamurella sp. PAMC28650 TaxID=2762325 RepID=UPI00164E5423|nr:FadR/GntR family transcriptional regulator [Nakamurella sp. PAMC28650]QNK81559.1 FadR family transcriptional regulator [Nakamurella sp. PAMC28650]
MFTALNNETLSSRVGRELIRSIVSGRFPPGELLPTEEQLCSEFGVSRSVVREAMKAVTGVGMARSRQGQGTVVLASTSWNNFATEVVQARRDTGAIGDVLSEVLELRTVIEVQASGFAAERGSDEDLDRMSELIEAMQAATGDTDVFIRLDVEFHDEILRASANHLIVSLFGLLHPLLLAAREIGVHRQQQPVGMNNAVMEHWNILESIRSGSAPRSRQAMVEHLANSAARETTTTAGVA